MCTDVFEVLDSLLGSEGCDCVTYLALPCEQCLRVDGDLVVGLSIADGQGHQCCGQTSTQDPAPACQPA